MVVGFPPTRLNKRNKANLKPPKNSQKKKKELPDILSESSSGVPEKVKIFGFPLAPSFSEKINEAAAKLGMTRSNFVRSAIARAIEEAGVSLGGSEVLCSKGARRDMATEAGAQKARAQIASARAVKQWKQGLRKRHDAFTADAIAQTWDNAAAKVGRKLRLDELEQCEREIVAALRAAAGMGGGPPVFPGLC